MKTTPHQTRVTTAGYEMLIPVAGVPTWRPANWEVSPLSAAGSLDDAKLRPFVRSWERLRESVDGQLFIERNEVLKASAYPNGECPHCGGALLGDGYRSVLHCENANPDRVWECEPDAQPVTCDRWPAAQEDSL